MKKIALITVVLLVFSQLKSQSITNITYSPINPTPTDTIYFYVDLMFPSSGCPLSNSGSSVVGQTVMASSLHCVGMLAAICNTTDTFMVLPLAAGNYTFDMTLSSGAGPVPCSPGIVPNDNRTENFVVSTITNIANSEVNTEIEIAPNPSSGLFNLDNLNNTSVLIYDVLGNELVNLSNLNQKYVLDLSNQPNGVYLMKTITNGDSKTYRLLKK